MKLREHLTRKTTAVLVLAPLVLGVAACGSSSSSSTGSTTSSATGGASGSASTSGLTKSTIVLGNVGSYTNVGQFGPQYTQAVHSLDAWASFTNAHGGLNGHPVKIISKDDGGSVAQSITAVKQLIEQDHVVAILAPMASNTDNGWAAYVQSKKVLVLGGQSLDANWDTNPYMLSTSVDQLNFTIGQFAAAKTVGSKVGIMTCAEIAACKSAIPFFQKIALQLGLKYGNTQLVSASSVNYTAPCLALKQTGSDVLVPYLDGPTARRAVDACADQGWKPKLALPSADLDAAALADSNFEGAVGVTISPAWFGTPTAATQDWATTYKALYPNDVLTGYSTLGWQAGVVLAAALKNAPDTVTTQTVLDGLYAQPAKSTFGGWTPPVTFPANKPAVTTACMFRTVVTNHVLTLPEGPNAICPS
jgi:branched-chain amino acid transport system substrate-binding protein